MSSIVNRRLLTVSQWSVHHPWPTPAGLRHLIFFAKSNGFECVIRRVGRRVLIDEAEFFRWLDVAAEAARLGKDKASAIASKRIA